MTLETTSNMSTTTMGNSSEENPAPAENPYNNGTALLSTRSLNVLSSYIYCLFTTILLRNQENQGSGGDVERGGTIIMQAQANNGLQYQSVFSAVIRLMGEIIIERRIARDQNIEGGLQFKLFGLN